VPLPAPTDAGATELALACTPELLAEIQGENEAGLLKVGDELIAFGSYEREPKAGACTLLHGCRRGFLGSPAAARDIPHATPAWLLRFADLTRLVDDLRVTGDELRVVTTQDFRPAHGYVLLGDEVVGYTERGETVLRMPSDGMDGDGLYHARFGTDAAYHGAGEIVYELPFRYWDRYAEEADDPSMALVQVARSRPGATWEDLRWEEEIPGGYLDLVCLLRFDGEPAWSADPGDRTGLLRLEDERQGFRGPVVADQVELRFLPRYLHGAYHESHDWKETPTLLSVQGTYTCRGRVLTHEVVR
jgi:hypothetical protein